MNINDLTLEEVNVILEGLAELQAKKVFMLINKIRFQVETQMKEQEEAKKASENNG